MEYFADVIETEPSAESVSALPRSEPPMSPIALKIFVPKKIANGSTFLMCTEY